MVYYCQKLIIENCNIKPRKAQRHTGTKAQSGEREYRRQNIGRRLCRYFHHERHEKGYEVSS